MISRRGELAERRVKYIFRVTRLVNLVRSCAFMRHKALRSPTLYIRHYLSIYINFKRKMFYLSGAVCLILCRDVKFPLNLLRRAPRYVLDYAVKF